MSGCPRGDVEARARINAAADQQHESRTRALVDAMAAALRSQLLTLLQAGDTVEAIQRYAASTGQDFSVAESVVVLLEGGRAAK